MNIKIFILITMIFCHIVDDYYLQGWLASGKQKSWWEKNVPNKNDYNELYKNDYLMALFCHSFSWSFMIQLPIFVYSFCYMKTFLWSIPLFIINLIIHMYVDDLKANQLKINLIQDQIIHFIQIIITWIILLY